MDYFITAPVFYRELGVWESTARTEAQNKGCRTHLQILSGCADFYLF